MSELFKFSSWSLQVIELDNTWQKGSNEYPIHCMEAFLCHPLSQCLSNEDTHLLGASLLSSVFPKHCHNPEVTTQQRQKRCTKMGFLSAVFIVLCNILAENYFLKHAKLLLGSPGLCSLFSVSDFCLICSNTGIDTFQPDCHQLNYSNCSYRKRKGYLTVFITENKMMGRCLPSVFVWHSSYSGL